MTNDTSLESPCALLLESKKNCKFAKIEFFIAKSSYKVEMFAKKICPKNEKLYVFEKIFNMPFKICKIFCKILNNLIFNQEKLKMCKFPLTGCLQKIAIFFAKLVQFVSLCQRLSKKLNFYQNLTSGSGSKQRFSLLQEKAVIQAVCLRTQAVSIKARF